MGHLKGFKILRLSTISKTFLSFLKSAGNRSILCNNYWGKIFSEHHLLRKAIATLIMIGGAIIV